MGILTFNLSDLRKQFSRAERASDTYDRAIMSEECGDPRAFVTLSSREARSLNSRVDAGKRVLNNFLFESVLALPLSLGLSVVCFTIELATHNPKAFSNLPMVFVTAQTAYPAMRTCADVIADNKAVRRMRDAGKRPSDRVLHFFQKRCEP